jgi:hypothetical protein
VILKQWHGPGLTKSARSFFCFVLALAFVLSSFGYPARAFNTYPSLGNIHRAILEEGLRPFVLSKGSLKIIARGMDSQDNPFSRNWLESEKHACDNRIREAFQYIDDQTNKAVDLAGNATGDENARESALYALGEGLHTLHDFYSHANYVEWLVRNKQPLQPIDRAKNGQLPSEIRTCYYFYASTFKQEPFLSHEENARRLKLKYPDMSFRCEAEYATRKKSDNLEEALDYVLRPGQFMHMEVNKDSAGQMEGRVKCGSEGETLFSVARQLAVVDTTRQWQCFEQRLSAKYGSRAQAILTALKDGKREKGQKAGPERESQSELQSKPEQLSRPEPESNSQSEHQSKQGQQSRPGFEREVLKKMEQEEQAERDEHREHKNQQKREHHQDEKFDSERENKSEADD